MDTTWIMVASRDEVRIFSRLGKGPLKLERDVANALGRLKTKDLVTDKAGASNDNRKPGRPAYSTEESPRDRALKDFYREIGALLDHSYSLHEFSRLVLIAEPRLLGILRSTLSEKVRQSVMDEIKKDLSYERAEQIAQRL